MKVIQLDLEDGKGLVSIALDAADVARVVEFMEDCKALLTPPEPLGWLFRPITELGADYNFWPRRSCHTLEEDEADLPCDLSAYEVTPVYTRGIGNEH